MLNYLDKNKSQATLYNNMGLFINGVWFGHLKQPFNPSFSMNWQESGYSNVMKGLVNSGKEVVKLSKKLNGVVDAISSVGGNFATSAEGIAKLTGTNIGQTGLMKKKIFDGTDFWNWSADLELIDFEGDGLVMKKYQELVNLAMPFVTSPEEAGAVAETSQKATENFLTRVGIDSDALEGAISRSIVKAPAPVHIRIGNYANTEGANSIFSMKVVISSFTPVFSIEQTDNGPVKMDLQIDFSSVEPMVGDAIPVRAGRVTINNEA